MIHLMSRKTLLATVTLFVCSLSVQAQLPMSRIFKPEGHGGGGTYMFPDDDVRRVTALDDVVTPHLKWGKPLLGGPVRVLALAHKEQGRWPIELKQRFDIELTTIYGFNREVLGSKSGRNIGMFVQDQADVEARVLQALNTELDVIISDFEIKALGDKVLERLTYLIKNGVGYIGPTDGLDMTGFKSDTESELAMINATVPFDGLRALKKAFDTPETAAGKAVKLWENKSGGHIADLDGYPRDGEYPDANRLQYLDQIDMEWESWSAVTGRILLWASGRVEAESLLKVDWPRLPVPRNKLPRNLPVKTNKIKANSLSVDVWDLDGRLHYHGDKARIPVLPADKYFVRVTILQEGKVRDWTFGTIEVSSPVEIASIKLDEKYKDLNQPVTASITLSKQPPKNNRIVVEGLDNFGRVFSTSGHPSVKELNVEVDTSRSMHIYNYVNVKIIDSKGRIVDEDRHSFFINQPRPDKDDLSWFIWGGADGFEPRRRILLKQHARMGASGFLEKQDTVSMVNAHSVLWVYHLKGITMDEEGIISPTLTDPGYADSQIGQIKETAKKFELKSPLFYYLGDDVKYTEYEQDGGWSASGRKALAEWAQNHYETIENVNQAWGTEYASWQDIEPVKRLEALSEIEAGNYAPFCHWIDVQLYEDKMFSDFYRAMSEGVHDVAPNTPSNMGSSMVGWTWPGSGLDWWNLAEDKDLVFQYPNPWIHDIYNSAAAADAYHGIWYGGYGCYNYYPYDDHEYLPWWSIFRGVNLHGLYCDNQDSTWYTERLLGADLGPMKGIDKIFKNFKELKGGTAKLLFNAKRKGDGIAIVYAPSNIHSSVIFDKDLPKADGWKSQETDSATLLYMNCWEALSNLIRDTGFCYDVIHESTLQDGKALLRDHKVVVLPLNLRLNNAQAKGITEFVQGGGTVVADIFPGLLNEDSRPDHEGVLANVFGVTYPGGLPSDRTKMEVAADVQGTPIGAWAVDTGVALKGADAKGTTDGSTPVVIVNKFGQGSAVLFNMVFRDYSILRTYGKEMGLRNLFANILATTNVPLKPKVNCEVFTAVDKTNHRIQATEFNNYQLDGAEYVGVLRHHKTRPDYVSRMADSRPKPCWITFDHKSHVYDIRRNMYRGYTDVIEDVIYPAKAELYALMPYEIRKVELSGSRVNNVLHLKGSVVTDVDSKLSTHVFHLEVIDPSGKVRTEYTANILAKAGQFETKIFIGHNANTNPWQVKAREIVSGLERSIKF